MTTFAEYADGIVWHETLEPMAWAASSIAAIGLLVGLAALYAGLRALNWGNTSRMKKALSIYLLVNLPFCIANAAYYQIERTLLSEPWSGISELVPVGIALLSLAFCVGTLLFKWFVKQRMAVRNRPAV